ncbi:MAG: tRNA (N(6)-L-threonylcarbamoyladenosine(37)-C(2))-methylthiotransferase [Candidatus Nanoarchaeia archaeon]
MDKIYITTYGCSMNAADSESIAGILKNTGFQLVSTEDEADLIIVNTCIVKEPSQENALSYIRKLQEKGKKVVVAGCMAQALPEKVSGYSLVGIDQIENIVEVVEETLNDNTVVLIARDKNKRMNLPRIRRNQVVEIIPIAQGCLGNCSYCIVKKARGELLSYEPEAIAERAQKAIREGAKELWITAQDTGCYGKDIDSSLPVLLKKIIALSGDFKVRVGMMNPNFAVEFVDELVDIFRSEKVFKFLHIPLQSGSDEVLGRMNRYYSVEDYKKIVKTLRQTHPHITIATDIICGFPGESEEQFQQTLQVIQETRPDIVNISRFWKRPGTSAAKLKQLPTQEIKSRSRRLTAWFEWIAMEKNKNWLHWEGKVLVDEKGKDNTWVARNYAYKPIILEGDYKLGDEVYVKVIKTTEHDLRAIEI